MENVVFFPKNGDENKVTLPADINKEIAEKYAPERQKNASFYASKRGGYPPSIFDCWYYKCAEFAAARFLHEKYELPLVEPDIKIYKSSEKNWNADLSYQDVTFLGKHHDQLRFHNKSATRKIVAKGYPESFMFQFANKNLVGGHDEILDKGNDDDYCVFVYVPYEVVTSGNVDFYVRGVIPWTFIKENNLLENPKKQTLIGVKLCVYTETVRRFLGKKVQAA
jgi:hypothetical protein